MIVGFDRQERGMCVCAVCVCCAVRLLLSMNPFKAKRRERRQNNPSNTLGG
jgi:hypothetical protein